MYIQPNSTVILLKAVPLDKNYENTLWFDSASDQYSHFASSYTKKTFSNISYQRVYRDKIRLQVEADSIYDYNYMLFQNTSFGSKWFYAFILSATYINNVTTEIEYQIDVMQTWLFQAILKPSFVEREHVATDAIGEWLQPEPVDTGDMVTMTYSKPDWFDNYEATLVIARTEGD